MLQLNVEGLTIAKLDILKLIATKNKVTVVVLQETHKANTTILKLPGYLLAGHTKIKHYSLATLVKEDVPWALTSQFQDDADVAEISTKVRNTTIVNVYNAPPTGLEQGSLQMLQPQPCTPATSTAGTLTGDTRPQTKTAPSWHTGPPQPRQCFSTTQRSPTHLSPDAEIPKPTRTWPLPMPSGKSHCRYSTSWIVSPDPNTVRH